MPFVIEMFDMEKYPHVDALLANCQGVFLNSVRPRLLGGVHGYLFILGLHCHAMKNKNANHSIQKD